MNIKLFNIFKNLELFSFLIIFVPISILIGNFWINLTTILIVIFGIKFFYIKIIVFFKENHKIILILLVFFLLNVIFSSNHLESLRSILGIIRYLLFGTILYFWFLKNDNNLKIFLFSIVISLIIVVLSIYLELFYKEFDKIPYNRLSGIFFDEKVAGAYISKLVFLVIFFLYVYYQKIFDNKFILFFIILFFYLGVIFSGDRSPLFILTFALCIYLIFNNNIKLPKKIIIILAAIFCFSLIYYFSEHLRLKMQYSFDQLGIEPVTKLLFTLDLEIKKKQKKNIIFKTFEIYKDDSKENIKRDFLKTKWGAHFITAFEIGKTNYILGSGIKTFRYECLNDKYISDIVNHSASYRCATHPHNIYFEVFSETGLLGLLIFFYLHYLIFRKVIKIKNVDIKITAISIFIVLFFPIQTTGSYFSTFNGIFYFTNLPVIIYLANKFRLNSKIIHT
jgi:hypothetical protein